MPEGLEGLAGEAIEKELGNGLSEFLSKFSEGQGYYKTARDVLSKSESGKVLLDHLDNTVIPQSHKTAEAYFNAAKGSVPASLPKNIRGQKLYDLAKDAKSKAFGDVRATYLGKNDEVLINALHSATKEKGPNYGNMATDSIEAFFHSAGDPIPVPGKSTSIAGYRTRKVPSTVDITKKISLSDVGISPVGKYRSPTQLENGIKNVVGWMNAPLIAIPHMGQVAALIFNNGIKNVSKAVFERFQMSEGNEADVLFKSIQDSGVLFENMMYQFKADGSSAGIFDKMFHYPGFNWVRRQSLVLGALTGKEAIIDAAERVVKDPSDKWAKFTMEKLGLKSKDFARNDFRLKPEDIERAMFSEANRSIRITRELDVPWKWQESQVSRLAFHYKDFAYSYGRMLGNGFSNAYKYGGAKQLAKTIGIFATVFPLVGEAVHSMERGALLKNPLSRDHPGDYTAGDVLAEYISALGYAGSLGIFNSLWRAGAYNYGKGWLEGPVAGDIEDLTIGPAVHSYKAIKYYSEGDSYKAQKQIQSGAREVVSKLGWPGRIAADKLLKDPDKQ
jgi:hypothetical protein